MTSRRLRVAIVALAVATAAFGQPRFRSGIFLHHSTGGCIWGPNGGQVSVPVEIGKYNRSHGLAGTDSVKMEETWWPSGDNEWATWHNIFDGKGGSDNIQSYLENYPIVMIKSCFPSANMSGIGSAEDSLNPEIKSTANYKWHWRSMVAMMNARPQNFFVIWTNAPQVAGSTNPSEAALSDAFCRWAKDTLEAGLDPVVGAFPGNVLVFDFFHLLAGADGMLPLTLASGSSDSHPNAFATALVAPQLVGQVFDAALAYEAVTSTPGAVVTTPVAIQLLQNYPNPFNPKTVISCQLSVAGRIQLVVYDLLGREVKVLMDELKSPGRYQVEFDGMNMSSGVYLYRLSAGDHVQIRRMTLLR